jgi:putative Mn2+ efflux pump MntP
VSLFLVLVSTAILVALFHMIAPDHWVPLLIISKTRNYTWKSKYATAVLLGLGHSGSSFLVAVLALFVGVVVLKSSVNILTDISILLMFIIAAYFIINGLREARESNDELMSRSALAVSAFPDLAFLPIFIAASGLGRTDTEYITAIFIAVTTLTLTAVVWLTSSLPGTDRLKNMPGRYTDYLIGLILVVTGVLIYLGL